MEPMAGSSGAPPLTDGENYRVTQGKQKNSRLIVHENFVYKLDKTELTRGDEVNCKYYLQCKYQSCPARAIIKNGFLSAPSQDRIPHTCVETEGAGSDKIAAQDVLNRMRTRAGFEATTFWVCTLFIN